MALAAADPVMASLIERHGELRPLRPLPASRRFDALVRAVVGQQLAGAAARAIHARLVTALGGTVTPSALLAARPEQLAAAGLSRAKATSLSDLAAKVTGGDIRLERIGRFDDDAVVAHLVGVRGIGPWTAHMFLLGTMGRPDVWPVGDLGVRTGFAAAWGMAAPPSPAELGALGQRFRPYRSLVARYCWLAADAPPPLEPPAS